MSLDQDFSTKLLDCKFGGSQNCRDQKKIISIFLGNSGLGISRITKKPINEDELSEIVRQVVRQQIKDIS